MQKWKWEKITGLERHLQAACTPLTLNKIRLLPPTSLPWRMSELSGNPYGLCKSNPLYGQDTARSRCLNCPGLGHLSQETNPSSADIFNSDNLRDIQSSPWAQEAKGIRMLDLTWFEPQVLPVPWSEQFSDTFTKPNGTIFDAAAIYLEGRTGCFCQQVTG